MAFTTFNPADWYWIVGGVPNQVFSSARCTYVSDTTDALYQLWLANPVNTPIVTSSQGDLANTLTQTVVPFYLTTGLQIIFNSNNTLNATYALDETTMTQVGSIARDVASGLGFPLGIATFVYPDIIGVPHTFIEPEFLSLYKALRNYIASVNNAVVSTAFGNFALLPVNMTTI